MVSHNVQKDEAGHVVFCGESLERMSFVLKNSLLDRAGAMPM